MSVCVLRKRKSPRNPFQKSSFSTHYVPSLVVATELSCFILALSECVCVCWCRTVEAIVVNASIHLDWMPSHTVWADNSLCCAFIVHDMHRHTTHKQFLAESFLCESGRLANYGRRCHKFTRNAILCAAQRTIIRWLLLLPFGQTLYYFYFCYCWELFSFYRVSGRPSIRFVYDVRILRLVNVICLFDVQHSNNINHKNHFAFNAATMANTFSSHHTVSERDLCHLLELIATLSFGYTFLSF